MSGKLIAIEGQDGSGKKTQADKLVTRLIREKDSNFIKTVAFPRYGQPSAKMVESYLKRELGPTETINAYEASTYYAHDRFAAAIVIRAWLTGGSIIIADRYTASNLAHQGGKIKDKNERHRFFQWLNWFEFEFLNNPRPALNLILDIPTEISFAAAKQRAIKKGRSLDGHEINFDHIKAATDAYKELAELFPDEYKLVGCLENGQWLSPEAIHEKVFALVETLL